MHNAQWGLRADALLISQSCTYWCHKACLRGVTKPAYAGMLKRGIGGITNGEFSKLAKEGLT